MKIQESVCSHANRLFLYIKQYYGKRDDTLKPYNLLQKPL